MDEDGGAGCWVTDEGAGGARLQLLARHRARVLVRVAEAAPASAGATQEVGPTQAASAPFRGSRATERAPPVSVLVDELLAEPAKDLALPHLRRPLRRDLLLGGWRRREARLRRASRRRGGRQQRSGGAKVGSRRREALTQGRRRGRRRRPPSEELAAAARSRARRVVELLLDRCRARTDARKEGLRAFTPAEHRVRAQGSLGPAGLPVQLRANATDGADSWDLHHRGGRGEPSSRLHGCRTLGASCRRWAATSPRSRARAITPRLTRRVASRRPDGRALRARERGHGAGGAQKCWSTVCFRLKLLIVCACDFT